MTWTAVRVMPSGAREGVVAALFAAGAQAVHDDGASVVTHFPCDTDIGSVRAALHLADAGATVTAEPTPDVDWSQAWKERIVAHEAGGFTIAPPWLATGLDVATTIVIDPGMAFGTGDHATTRGVLRLMRSVLVRGDTVADLGAGSAVLSIAAARLGAARVAAIEIDPDAIANGEANVQRNGVAGTVQIIQGDAAVLLPLVAPVRLILANIISSVLLRLLPAMRVALPTGGHAILSGILFDERDTIVAALAQGDWRMDAEDREEMWWSATVSPR